MNLKSIIDSILFVHGDEIATEKIAAILNRSKEETKAALDELQKEYETRGFALVENNGSWQLGSHPENAPYIEELAKSEFSEELSRAALETLAIIAYKGPIAKPDIEYIRGVNCSFTLRNLLMRGLIERQENLKDARSYLYRVSVDFLKHLGLTKLEELPRYEEFKKEKIGVAKSDEMV
jgi:segregation and condensation protein B